MARCPRRLSHWLRSALIFRIPRARSGFRGRRWLSHRVTFSSLPCPVGSYTELAYTELA